MRITKNIYYIRINGYPVHMKLQELLHGQVALGKGLGLEAISVPLGREPDEEHTNGCHNYASNRNSEYVNTRFCFERTGYF